MKTLKNENFIVEANFSIDNFGPFENLLEEYTAKMQNEIKDLQARVDRVRSDANLSTKGQDLEISKIYAEKKAFMDGLKKDIESRFLDQSQDLARKLNDAANRASFTTGDPVRDEIRADGIRRWFLDIDPALRELKLNEALRSGDLELVDAIISAPKCYGLVSESFAQSVTARKAATLDPTSANLQSDIRTLRGVMDYNFRRIENILEPARKVAARVEPDRYDPLVMQAKGIDQEQNAAA